MSKMANQKRNEKCNCGSNKKYKHCCLTANAMRDLQLSITMREKEYEPKKGDLNISIGRPVECEQDIYDMFTYMEKLHKMETDKAELGKMIKRWKNNPKECKHLVFNSYKEKNYIQWICRFISDEQIHFMGDKQYL